MENTTKKPRKPRNSPPVAGDAADLQGDLLGNDSGNLGRVQGALRERLARNRGPLDNFFDEIKKGSENKAYVRIKRIVDHERAYLVQGGKVLWTEYPGPEFIEKNWGGGNYLVEYYSGGTEPRDRLPRAVEKVDIEGPAREHLPELVKPAYAAPQPQQYAPEQLAGHVAQAIAQSMSPVLAAMAAAIERLHVPPAAPVAPPPSLLDLTQALKNMQSLIPAPAPPAAAPAPVDTFGQLRDMMALAKEFTNPDGGENNPLAFLEKAIDKLGGPLIEHLQSERERQPPQPQSQPSPGVAVRILPKNQLQKDLDTLLDLCARGEPAQNVVSIAINMIPEHMLPHLLNEPDPISLLARYEPRATQLPYQPWLVELFAYIREEELSEDADPGDPQKA